MGPAPGDGRPVRAVGGHDARAARGHAVGTSARGIPFSDRDLCGASRGDDWAFCGLGDGGERIHYRWWVRKAQGGLVSGRHMGDHTVAELDAVLDALAEVLT